MRLIDADRTAADIMGYFERNDLSSMSEQDLEYVKCIVSKFAEILIDENCTPTIDAHPVKHGKWQKRNKNGYDAFRCSECGLHFDYKFKFCPNCCADMRGGTDDA